MALGQKKVASSQHRRTVGVFASRQDVEYVLTQLRDGGFRREKISLITNQLDHDERLLRDNTMRELVNKARKGTTTGTVKGLVKGNVLGSLAGLLVGLSTLAIPGIGSMILAGTAGTAIAFSLFSGAIGAASGGLIGALIGLGITENQARIYSDLLSQGAYLVIIHGTDDEIRCAESIFSTTKNISTIGRYLRIASLECLMLKD